MIYLKIKNYPSPGINNDMAYIKNKNFLILFHSYCSSKHYHLSLGLAEVICVKKLSFTNKIMYFQIDLNMYCVSVSSNYVLQ